MQVRDGPGFAEDARERVAISPGLADGDGGVPDMRDKEVEAQHGGGSDEGQRRTSQAERQGTQVGPACWVEAQGEACEDVGDRDADCHTDTADEILLRSSLPLAKKAPFNLLQGDYQDDEPDRRPAMGLRQGRALKPVLFLEAEQLLPRGRRFGAEPLDLPTYVLACRGKTGERLRGD